jgi:hypothetical protein
LIGWEEELGASARGNKKTGDGGAIFFAIY